MYEAIGHIMCIQCSRCLTVFGCRNNPWVPSGYAGIKNIGQEAMNCPADFHFVANCVVCYK